MSVLPVIPCLRFLYSTNKDQDLKASRDWQNNLVCPPAQSRSPVASHHFYLMPTLKLQVSVVVRCCQKKYIKKSVTSPPCCSHHNSGGLWLLEGLHKYCGTFLSSRYLPDITPPQQAIWTNNTSKPVLTPNLGWKEMLHPARESQTWNLPWR